MSIRQPAVEALRFATVRTLAIAAVLVSCSARLPGDDAEQLKVPPGFTVTQYAGDSLAHDIFSMTIDSLGRVVVSGPGFVRILIDANHDGVADTYKQYADGPASGAQGMYFLGRDLLCTGDGGLIRYRDQNGDDRADGAPDVFLRLKTGGEHYSHSVQKGPDGWWYVIVGNEGRVSRSYVTLPASPLRAPQAGTMIRLKPNLTGGEVIADGMRNAYDFAFNGAGDLFVFDSDSEREVSLPWYRPTRVLHTLPGSHAGWVSQSWIRPDHYLDMPTDVASFGRGSPTGVVCYRHTQFPSQYQGALFVLDWTFGRVMAVPLTARGATWTSEPQTFMTGKGPFGFAPTDVEVGPGGDLFVCVGGRGTQGAVYRVSYDKMAAHAGSGKTSDAKTSDSKEAPSDDARREMAAKDLLSQLLSAPQPQSSWSRAAWIPEATQLGRPSIRDACLNPWRNPSERARAIEILTELFDGVDPQTLAELSADKHAAVRARAVWSAGRSTTHSYRPVTLKPYVMDADPSVARSALEALWTVRLDGTIDSLLPDIARKLADDDRTVRFAAARLVGRLDPEKARTLSSSMGDANPRARLWFTFGRCERATQLDVGAVESALGVFEKADAAPLRLEALRVMQIALGDCGPGRSSAPMFDGYTSRLDLKPAERDLDPIRIRLARRFPTNDGEVDAELARIAAMLTPYNGVLLERVLAQISAESDPVRDIHFLAVAARIPIDRNAQQSQKMAEALISLEPKIFKRKLNQDRNWDDRVGEMYKRLVALDVDLPAFIVSQKGFGRPGHVLFLSEIGPEQLAPAVDAFVQNIKAQADFKWTNGVVFLLGESTKAEHRALLREKYAEFAVRSAVVMTLAQKPEPIDRPKFLEGLDSSQLEVVAACLGALEKLPPDGSADERFALVKGLRRLQGEKPEFVLRERLVRLLQRGTQKDFGFVFGEAGYVPQQDVAGRWMAWLEETYPAETARLREKSGEDPEQVRKLLSSVDWQHGDPERGRKVFETRTCAGCHGGSKAVGPDLAGAAQRFARDDLFTAIVQPNRDVSARYRTTMIQTRDGHVYTGLIVYESVDGLILRNAANQTFRIRAADIEERRGLKTSLMPAGLLKDAQPADVADLYAYLRSMSANPPQEGHAASLD